MKKNKLLLGGAAGMLALWLGGYFLISGNWATAAAQNQSADDERAKWAENFTPGPNLMPRKQAGDELLANQKAIGDNLKTLKQIEFGTLESLRAFSLLAAGTEDEKSFLSKKRNNLIQRAKGMNIPILQDDLTMGAEGKVEKDPVSVNLLRVAMVEHFLTACQRAGVAQIRKVEFNPPRLLKGQEDEAEAESGKGSHNEKSKAKESEKDKTAAAPADKLVQYHMRVTVLAPERAFGKLLFELQKPSDSSRGYLCLRGFQVAVRDSGSGRMEAALAVSALLTEKVLQDLKVPFKADDEKRSGGRAPLDTERY